MFSPSGRGGDGNRKGRRGDFDLWKESQERESPSDTAERREF